MPKLGKNFFYISIVFNELKIRKIIINVDYEYIKYEESTSKCLSYTAYLRASWKVNWVEPTVLILETRVIKPSFCKDLFSTIKNPFLKNKDFS